MAKRPKGEKATFTSTWASFINALKSMNKVVPGVVVVGAGVFASVVWTLTLAAPLMVTGTILIVLLVSLVIYGTTDNYGEAALALVAGLLTVFTVEWTVPWFVAFCAAWGGFTFIALLIGSVKLAAKSEDIYVQAALSLAARPADSDEVRKKLEAAGKRSGKGVLGPIDRAEVVRVLAFRNVPVDSIQYALEAVELLSVITKVDSQSVALFVADVYRLFESQPGPRYQVLLDRIYNLMKMTPVAPDEFINAFDETKTIALRRDVTPDQYLSLLKKGLEIGVRPGGMNGYMRREIGEDPDGSDGGASDN